MTFDSQEFGWDVILSQDEYVEISDGSTRILFTRVDGYQGAGWPTSTSSKRYHLCSSTPAMAKAVERCLELGAARPDFQPGGDRWDQA